MLQFLCLLGLWAPPAGSGEVIVHVRPADASIRLDGALVAPGRPVWVKAGVHRLEVTRAGRAPHRKTFVLDAGGRTRFDVVLRAARATPAAPPRPAAAAPVTRARPTPWVLPGQDDGVITDSVGRRTDLRPVGNAMFITALVTGFAAGIVGIITQVRVSRFEDERDYERKVEDRDAAQSLALATNILLGVTTVFATTGFVLYMANDPGPRARPAGVLGFRGTF